MLSRGTDALEVVVVGAGAAGIGAATRLAAARISFMVIEARSRVGGRAYTVADAPFPLDLGCGVAGGNYRGRQREDHLGAKTKQGVEVAARFQRVMLRREQLVLRVQLDSEVGGRGLGRDITALQSAGRSRVAVRKSSPVRSPAEALRSAWRLPRPSGPRRTVLAGTLRSTATAACWLGLGSSGL